MKDKLRILMCHTQGGGVGYYRFWQPAAELNRLGHNVTYSHDEVDFFDAMRVPELERLEGAGEWFSNKLKSGEMFDVLHMGYSTVINHVKWATIARNMASKAFNHNMPYMVDIDDDPHSVPTYNPAWAKYNRTADEKRNLIIHIRTSDAISVSTPPLIPSLRSDAPPHMYLLPNYTNPPDWDHFPVAPNRGDDHSIRLMFCGGLGHYGDLEQVKDVMERIIIKYDGKEGRPLVRLFWLGCTPDWAAKWMASKVDPLANRAFYIQPSHINIYWQAVRWISPDILFAPVECNEFNKSKSIIKAYDAVLGNSAFICTDWDTYDELPDETCSKARGEFQWQATLEALIEDKSLRAKKAAKLREWVFDTRQIKDHIYKWVDAYVDVMSRPAVNSLNDIIRPRIYRPDGLLA